MAGEVSDDTFSGIVEAYNGTTYSEVNDLNQSRRGHAGAGTAAAGLAFGGQTPPYTAKNELWNGYVWTEVNDLNNARAFLGGCGISTSALAFGGKAPALGPPNVRAETEQQNHGMEVLGQK